MSDEEQLQPKSLIDSIKYFKDGHVYRVLYKDQNGNF